MTYYELLLACYRSGQVSEHQWQRHLQDRGFREWLERGSDAPLRFRPEEQENETA